MLKIYVLHHCQDLQQHEFAQLTLLPTNEKFEMIKKQHSYINAQRILLGDALSRYSICESCNLQNSDLTFSTNEFGKPFLSNRPDIQYNISHAGHYVACALGQFFPVGVDVEQIKPNNLKIAKRFFAKDECDYLLSQPAELQLETFYQLWTMKESYVKMIGKGLSIPLDSFSVLKQASNGQTCFKQFIKSNEILGNICTEKMETITCEAVDCSGLLLWAQTQV